MSADTEGGAPAQAGSRLTGGMVAVGSFVIWSFLPLYFNLIRGEVSPWESFIHRIIWSGAALFVFLMYRGRLHTLAELCARRRAMLALAGSALVLFGNWAVFIWAVTHGHILDVSLGFYISPLLNVLFGFCFLKERLTRLQVAAVLLAALGVMVAIVGYGFFPWIALLIGATFAIYGLIRKQVAVDSATGLLFETLLVMPFTLAWMVWMYADGTAYFLQFSWRIDLWLIGGGVIGVIPLVMFSFAARRLRLSTLGFFQYISPTGHFLTAVFLYGEAFIAGNAIAFIFIWFGLALYTFDIWRVQRYTPAAPAPSLT